MGMHLCSTNAPRAADDTSPAEEPTAVPESSALGGGTNLLGASGNQEVTSKAPRLSKSSSGRSSKLRTYTVFLKEPEETGHVLREGDLNGLKEWHLSFLLNTSLHDSGETRLVYSFRRVITGFVAMLTDEEAEAILTNEGVVDVVSNDIQMRYCTTHEVISCEDEE